MMSLRKNKRKKTMTTAPVAENNLLKCFSKNESQLNEVRN